VRGSPTPKPRRDTTSIAKEKNSGVSVEKGGGRELEEPQISEEKGASLEQLSAPEEVPESESEHSNKEKSDPGPPGSAEQVKTEGRGTARARRPGKPAELVRVLPSGLPRDLLDDVTRLAREKAFLDGALTLLSLNLDQDLLEEALWDLVQKYQASQPRRKSTLRARLPAGRTVVRRKDGSRGKVEPPNGGSEGGR